MPMTSVDRRLQRLEAITPRQSAAVCRERAWLKTLTDADLEVLETVLTLLEDSGDVSSIPAAASDRYAELDASWQRFCDDR